MTSPQINIPPFILMIQWMFCGTEELSGGKKGLWGIPDMTRQNNCSHLIKH
jgi:hypothetical protein